MNFSALVTTIVATLQRLGHVIDRMEICDPSIIGDSNHVDLLSHRMFTHYGIHIHNQFGSDQCHITIINDIINKKGKYTQKEVSFYPGACGMFAKYGTKNAIARLKRFCRR
jgi:hypothetical protein